MRNEHNKEIDFLNGELDEAGVALKVGSRDETKHSKAINEGREEVRAFYRKYGGNTTKHNDTSTETMNRTEHDNSNLDHRVVVSEPDQLSICSVD